MFADCASLGIYLEYMRQIRISRRGWLIKSNKAMALCVGANGAGNNSQSDCLLKFYENEKTDTT